MLQEVGVCVILLHHIIKFWQVNLNTDPFKETLVIQNHSVNANNCHNLLLVLATLITRFGLSGLVNLDLFFGAISTNLSL